MRKDIEFLGGLIGQKIVLIEVECSYQGSVCSIKVKTENGCFEVLPINDSFMKGGLIIGNGE